MSMARPSCSSLLPISSRSQISIMIDPWYGVVRAAYNWFLFYKQHNEHFYMNMPTTITSSSSDALSVRLYLDIKRSIFVLVSVANKTKRLQYRYHTLNGPGVTTDVKKRVFRRDSISKRPFKL